MRRVTRRVGDVERPVDDRFAPGEDADRTLGHSHELTPQPVHVLAVQTPRALQQAPGIDHVRRASLVDVHLEVGPPLHERAARTGVVEMDVGEQQRPGARVAERLEQRRQA